MYELVEKNRTDPLWGERPHMIMCATGDINLMVRTVLTKYADQGICIRPGPVEPKSDELMGLRQGLPIYTAQTHPNSGCLIAFANPWWGDRIVIICGGIHGAGTIGALWLLHEYLSGRGDKYGNNEIDPNIPGKILQCTLRKYTISIKDSDELTPQHDIRNLAEIDRPVRTLE